MEQIAKLNHGIFSAREEVQNGYNLGNEREREREVIGMGEQSHKGKKEPECRP